MKCHSCKFMFYFLVHSVCAICNCAPIYPFKFDFKNNFPRYLSVQNRKTSAKKCKNEGKREKSVSNILNFFPNNFYLLPIVKRFLYQNCNSFQKNKK